MALPRLNENSQYELTIPSKKEVVQYRPFLVKEQKVLLIAYESQDRRQILNAMLPALIRDCQDQYNSSWPPSARILGPLMVKKCWSQESRVLVNF